MQQNKLRKNGTNSDNASIWFINLLFQQSYNQSEYTYDSIVKNQVKVHTVTNNASKWSSNSD